MPTDELQAARLIGCTGWFGARHIRKPTGLPDSQLPPDDAAQIPQDPTVGNGERHHEPRQHLLNRDMPASWIRPKSKLWLGKTESK
jgi:hypothetical protein